MKQPRPDGEDDRRSDAECVAPSGPPRCGDTEPAFTGKYWDCKDPGVYHCSTCARQLFASTSKYDSGSGWPSFTAPVREEMIDVRADTSHGMMRTEVMCGGCGAHLGHVFPDGPAPTGLRYCINSFALALAPQK